MISSTSRSRLYELRRDRQAAQRGAELLDRKREVLLHETSRRSARAESMRKEAECQYRDAIAALHVAEVEVGREGVMSAAVAQTMTCHIESHRSTVMGVGFTEVRAAAEPFRAQYGAAATGASLDAAASAFNSLLPHVIELAAEESALARLRLAVRKATKIVNALQKVILPRLAEQIRTTVDSIAEEERDEAVRNKVRLAAH